MPTMPNWYRPLLYTTVFLTGAAVLIFEVTAVRALSPYFGSSIYVVSSVLTVILAALSLGYYFGGRLADRRPDIRLLYLIIAFAGLLMNCLYALSVIVFPIAGQLLSIVIGPLIISCLFFLLPAFLLGIDSPFVIKLLTSNTDIAHNGAVVGSTFFWSTVGSITGSLLSGFVLIPFLGVQLSFLGTATLLSLFACIGYLVSQSQTKQKDVKVPLFQILGVTILSVLIAVLTFRADPIQTHAGKLLHRSDGFYSQIEIREQPITAGFNQRSLYREINSSSAIFTGTTTFPFRYAEYARTYRPLQENTDSFLLIGGGAYTIPRTLLAEDPNLHIDVVEIEPRLFALAQQYFELQDSPRLINYTMDARTFLNTTEKKYDVIFADAFQSGHFIPPHLVTQEFFQSVYDHLSEDGIFIANIIGRIDQEDKNLTGSIIKTIRTIFPQPSIYAAQLQEDHMANFILIARKNGAEVAFPEDFMVDLKNGTFVPVNERERPLSRFHVDTQQVFTDDLAPVELLVAKQILNY